MGRAPNIRLPEDLPGAKRYEREVGMIVTPANESDYQLAHNRLAMMGFSVQQESSGATVFMKKKTLGPLQIVGILVGLFLFILPGVLIMLAWAIQGNPTVVLMKPQKAPKAQATPSTNTHAAGSGGGGGVS